MFPEQKKHISEKVNKIQVSSVVGLIICANVNFLFLIIKLWLGNTLTGKQGKRYENILCTAILASIL